MLYAVVILHCALCRRSGYFLGPRYGPGQGQIWLDNLQCTGSETQLGYCSHSGWGNHNCKHDEDVSISCNNDTSYEGLYMLRTFHSICMYVVVWFASVRPK